MTPLTAWNELLTIGGMRRYTLTGFYAIGDAGQISGAIQLQGRLILVEHRVRVQVNHWQIWVLVADYPGIQPSIVTDGDDGFGSLDRRAAKLLMIED
jgi:hypothetical protein